MKLWECICTFFVWCIAYTILHGMFDIVTHLGLRTLD